LTDWKKFNPKEERKTKLIRVDVTYTDDVVPSGKNVLPSPMPPIFQTFKVRSPEEIQRYLEWPVEATKAEITYTVRRENDTSDGRRKIWNLDSF
jgi:hypothetical protein